MSVKKVFDFYCSNKNTKMNIIDYSKNFHFADISNKQIKTYKVAKILTKITIDEDLTKYKEHIDLFDLSTYYSNEYEFFIFSYTDQSIYVDRNNSQILNFKKVSDGAPLELVLIGSWLNLFNDFKMRYSLASFVNIVPTFEILKYILIYYPAIFDFLFKNINTYIVFPEIITRNSSIEKKFEFRYKFTDIDFETFETKFVKPICEFINAIKNNPDVKLYRYIYWIEALYNEILMNVYTSDYAREYLISIFNTINIL